MAFCSRFQDQTLHSLLIPYIHPKGCWQWKKNINNWIRLRNKEGPPHTFSHTIPISNSTNFVGLCIIGVKFQYGLGVNLKVFDKGTTSPCLQFFVNPRLPHSSEKMIVKGKKESEILGDIRMCVCLVGPNGYLRGIKNNGFTAIHHHHMSTTRIMSPPLLPLNFTSFWISNFSLSGNLNLYCI